MAAMMVDANLDLLDQPWRSLLKVMVLVCAAGTLVSGHRQAEAEGPPSRALDVFNTRVMVWVGACLFTFAVGAAISHRVPLGTPERWLLGLVTSIPALALIWTTARYLADETDEYLRQLAMMSALIGLAVVLAIASVWGVLEALGLVPHFSTWWLIPIFGFANGAGRAWLKARSR
jgi:hypothetical protein